MDTEQRASQIGSGLTSRFRNQVSAFENYSRNKNLSMQGRADAYRTNLIEQYNKSDTGKLLNSMMKGQMTAEGGTSALALGHLGLKGANRFYSGRLARQQAKTGEARSEVDRAFPEKEENDEDVGGEDTEGVGIEAEPSENPVISQGISQDLPTTSASDFSGDSSGIPGVSSEGSIQVSSSYTQGADPATATTESSDITSQLPVQGLGEPAPAGLAPPSEIPTGYSSSSQLGLSEEGMAARNTALQSYSDIYSQAPRQVMFDNTSDPPLSDIMDRMQQGDLTLGDSPSMAVSQQQAGTKLSNLLDTSAEQADTTSLSFGNAAEQEAIQSGAQSVDIGAGPRAITQTELAKPSPTVQQPGAPRPTEPIAEDSPFNPSGGVQESSSSDLAIDANTHRALTQAVENPNSTASTSSASQNLEQVQASIGKGSSDSTADIASAGENLGDDAAGLTTEQTVALTGLEGASAAEGITEGVLGAIGTASAALGVLAPLGMLAGLIYQGVSEQKEYNEEEKKMTDERNQLQGEIGVEDNESQFTAGRPAFGSMSLAPNVDMKTSS